MVNTQRIDTDKNGTFQQIYQAPDMQTFRHLLQKWYHWVSQCSLLPMVETAKMVKTLLARYHHVEWYAPKWNQPLFHLILCFQRYFSGAL
jgi:hypothetical protein